jgi:hypothetical protein
MIEKERLGLCCAALQYELICCAIPALAFAGL